LGIRYGAEAVKDLPNILTHSEFMKHVTVEGDMPSVLQSPATAVTLVYFPSDISTTRKDEVSKLVGRLIHDKLDAVEDVKAVSFGWSVENDFPVFDREEKDSGSGTVFAVFMGWSSVGALEAFREANGDRGVSEKIGDVAKVTCSITRLIQCREFGVSEW
jgi:hypothetical protein